MAKLKRKLTQVQLRARAIKELEDKNGRITAEALVKAAEDENHPMHNDFLWDDEIAGHKYRISQARTYIAEVRVTITTSTKKLDCVGYVRDPSVAPGPGYIATARLQSKEDESIEALKYETARLQAQFERCRELAAVLELEEELEIAMNAINTFAGRLRKRSSSIQPQEIRA